MNLAGTAEMMGGMEVQVTLLLMALYFVLVGNATPVAADSTDAAASDAASGTASGRVAA